MNSCFSILPYEVTQAIFSWTSYKELTALQKTCRLFYLQIHHSKELKEMLLESWIDTPMLPCYTVRTMPIFFSNMGGGMPMCERVSTLQEALVSLVTEEI